MSNYYFILFEGWRWGRGIGSSNPYIRP